MKLWYIIIVTFLSLNVFSQTNSSIESNQDIDKFEIRSNVFKLISELNISFSDNNIQSITDQLEKLKTISAYSTKVKSASLLIEDYFNNYILNSNLDQLIEFQDEDYYIDIYIDENENLLIEEISMLVTNINSTNTIYLQILGEIDLEKIVALATELNVPGANFLKKIN
jgi:hypothetical protein